MRGSVGGCERVAAQLVSYVGELSRKRRVPARAIARAKPDRGIREQRERSTLLDCTPLFPRLPQPWLQIVLAKMTAEGSVISEPYSVDTKWDFKSFVAPKASTDTGGSW
jgi:20S proteasome subunit beta 7